MGTLYLAWRRLDHRWWPVGRLSREGSEYVFTYTQGARSAEAAGFRPLSSFPDFDQVYVSAQLFPMFQNRLPPRSRPDYRDFIEWLDLEGGEADPLVMLARSGGQRETDMFEVFPIPEENAEGRYRSTFFVHGLRHQGPSAEEEVRRLRPGDALAFEAERANPHDPREFRIHTGVRGVEMGLVPRYLCQDLHALLSAAGEQAQARVQCVNLPPAPAQFRVLCSLDSPWPQGFRSFASPDLDAFSRQGSGRT
jgi:HIRAN domain-containing protein